MDSATSTSSLSRRALLGTAASGTLVGLSGCLRAIRNFFREPPADVFSLSVASVDPDVDPQAAALADTLESALETAGIDVERVTYPRGPFLRRVLVDHEFDLFVGRTPRLADPAQLYGALHTRFAEEWGWQNPYGFSNTAFDERLDQQRQQTGEARTSAVERTLESLANNQPFTPLCRPIECHLWNADRFDGFDRHSLADRYAFVDVDVVDAGASLRAVVTDPDVTHRLNPLGIERRHSLSPVDDLLYDSLATAVDGELVPWLAETWSREDGEITMRLREATWHDGETLTADDVAFTYEFLADTSMGDADVPAPSPVRRGLATAIESITVVDDRRLRIDPGTAGTAAERAFTVPILPEHVWRDRTDSTEFPDVETPSGTTTAVVTDNVPPIGSGLYAFADRVEGERVELDRNDDHFATTASSIPTPPIPAIEITVADGTNAALELVEADDADLTLSPLDPATAGSYVPLPPLERHDRPSQSIYCIGYNARDAPLSNPYFRRTTARLLDKPSLVETVFAGEATPIASPLDEPWRPSSLEWTGSDPITPFLGENGDLDVAAVRDAFEAFGHRYDNDGNLLARS